MRIETPWPMPTVPGLRARGGRGFEVTEEDGVSARRRERRESGLWCEASVWREVSEVERAGRRDVPSRRLQEREP